MGNPRTTILGILTIVGAAIHAILQYNNGQAVDATALMAQVSAGIGLIMAKDSTTHSTPEQVEKAGLIEEIKAASPHT